MWHHALGQSAVQSNMLQEINTAVCRARACCLMARIRELDRTLFVKDVRCRGSEQCAPGLCTQMLCAAADGSETRTRHSMQVSCRENSRKRCILTVDNNGDLHNCTVLHQFGDNTKPGSTDIAERKKEEKNTPLGVITGASRPRGSPRPLS